MGRIDEAVGRDEDLEEILKLIDDAEDALFSEEELVKDALSDAFSVEPELGLSQQPTNDIRSPADERPTEDLPAHYAILDEPQGVQDIHVIDIQPDPDSRPKPPPPASASTVDALGDLIASLPKEQRVNILQRFCMICGSDWKSGTTCNCEFHRAP